MEKDFKIHAERASEDPPRTGIRARRIERRRGEHAVLTTVRFPLDLKRALDEAAAVRGVSLSRFVTDACRQALSEEDGPDPG